MLSFFEDKEDFLSNISAKTALFGLDVGKKTIGVALSDLSLTVASPLLTIKRTQFSKDFLQLKELIVKYNVSGLVIGIPLSMDGEENNKACQSIKQFARNILKEVNIPITFQDERFSTNIADEFLDELEIKGKRRKKKIDRIAAGYILQSFLDN